MTTPETDYTEDSLVEQPTIDLFEELGWETVNAYHETLATGEGSGVNLGRNNQREVVLTDRLRPKLEQFNDDVPDEAIDQAVEELRRSRKAMHQVEANRDIYEMIENGVQVTHSGEEGEPEEETVRVIDWKEPDNNDFLLVSQLWIDGPYGTKRTDLVGFVNGLPMLLVELKRTGVNVKEGFDNNISDYKSTIPQLFWYNQAIMISNGNNTRIGSMSAEWDHYGKWKKRDEEDERVISLERAVRSACRTDRFMDLVENFILFTTAWGDLEKILAKNHQYVGVNEAYDALGSLDDDDQQLGVFWHTQGSGKSYSMAFFSQKVFRKMHGNWTFVIVTDRLDLDDQVYDTFGDADLISSSEDAVRADSGEDLRKMLKGDNKYVFTTVQKFQTEDEEASYPVLSERNDIIVMSDEAHRTQYGELAMNMRKALPNARYMAFTGTPLMEEEQTKEVFGDYVSVYDFAASEQDDATVPLYYANRIPEVNLDEQLLEEGLDEIAEEFNLSEDEEDRLSREYSKQAKFLKRDKRLETIAEDIALHFPQRGFKGKGMVVSVDRFTAVRMYDKVQKYWQKRIEEIEDELQFASGERADELNEELQFMKDTEMNVVISKSQNEIEEFDEKGLDIRPHREKMENEDLKTRFQDADDDFNLVFLCAKWMTGFDCPSCSTLYLDKPMKNHTLMQAIARTNRKFEDKGNGLIVDYVGLLRKLKKALAIYATGERGKGTAKEGEMPVKRKEELVEKLEEELEGMKSFCGERDIPLEEIVHEGEYDIIGWIDKAGDILVEDPEDKETFLNKAQNVRKLYRAVLPDPEVEEHAPVCKLIERIEDEIKSLQEPPDIDHLEPTMEDLLDEAVDIEPPKVAEPGEPYDDDELYNLSRIDFEALKEQFEKTEHKNTKVERLRNLLEQKVEIMARKNKYREDLLERFEQIVEEYNAGSKNVEKHFEELIEFAESLEEEEQRKIREGLDEEELAIFDILTKPKPELDPSQEDDIKQVAKDLLNTLKQEKLVLDWKKREKTKNMVEVAIEDLLTELPPEIYDKELYEEKCDRIYNHVFETYEGEGDNIYVRTKSSEDVPA